MLPFIVLAVLLLIFTVGIWVVGKQLPTDWEIEKAVLLEARPEQVFPYLQEVKLWEEWSIWNQEPNRFQLHYKGSKIGIGASQLWKNSQLQGQMTLTHCEPPRELQYHLDINQGKFILSGTIVLSVTDATFTQMAWRCTARPPKQFQFLLRYQMYFLKRFFDKAIEESLNGMQQIFQTQED